MDCLSDRCKNGLLAKLERPATRSDRVLGWAETFKGLCRTATRASARPSSGYDVLAEAGCCRPMAERRMTEALQAEAYGAVGYSFLTDSTGGEYGPAMEPTFCGGGE